MDQDQQKTPTYEDLAQLIDLPLLAPQLKDDDIMAGCRLAEQYGIASVTVQPSEVDLAVRSLSGSAIRVGAAIGHPYGSGTTGAKLYEGRELLRRGAKEIDFTLNLGKMLSRQFPYIETELLQMADSCAKAGATFKVVLENSFLAYDLKLIALKICKRVAADFAVAGSIDAPFALDDLKVLKEHQGFRLQLKAQGVITTLDQALACRDLGCTRLGTTAVAPILDAWKAHLAQLETSPAAPGASL